MKRRIFVLFSLLSALSLLTGFVLAADQQRAQERVQKQEQEQIYGNQLMTQQEPMEYRAKMGNAKTAGEREQIRNRHNERMNERVSKSGVALPGESPTRVRGMGSGGGGIGSGRDGMGSRISPGGGGRR